MHSPHRCGTPTQTAGQFALFPLRACPGSPISSINEPVTAPAHLRFEHLAQLSTRTAWPESSSPPFSAEQLVSQLVPIFHPLLPTKSMSYGCTGSVSFACVVDQSPAGMHFLSLMNGGFIRLTPWERQGLRFSLSSSF